MSSLIYTILYSLPLIIPAIIGLVTGAVYFQRARKAATLVIIASVLLWVQSGYSVVAQMLIVPSVGDVMSWETYALINSVVHMVLGLSIMILLICAAFAGRGQPGTSSQNTTTAQASSHGLPHAPAGYAQAPNHRGTLVLTLGLISLLVFQPLGLAPWIIGVQDLRAMREGRMDPEGRGTTLAGMILGIIAIVLFVLTLIAVGLFISAFVNSSGWRY